MGLSSEDEIPIDGGAPVRIPPGQYDAIVLWHRRVMRFKRLIISFRFKIMTIGPYQGTELDAWVALGENGKAGKGSKLVRWFQAIAEPDSRWDKVRLKTFREYLLLVEVETVERDHHQKQLPTAQYYSVVRNVVGTVGRL